MVELELTRFCELVVKVQIRAPVFEQVLAHCINKTFIELYFDARVVFVQTIDAAGALFVRNFILSVIKYLIFLLVHLPGRTPEGEQH